MPTFYEYVGNLHMHTPYSDGESSHAQIAEAAINAGLDFVVVTDHNVLVQGVEGYYSSGERRLLLLTGEEIHDQTRQPQVNHCLIYGVNQEIAQCASDPQGLIDAANAAGGMAFLAHPLDHAIEWVHESAIPWVDWEVQRYTGLEIWNYMANFKNYIQSPLTALRNVFNPENAVIGPARDVIARWDELLTAGHRVVGIGNSDAHGTTFQFGPLKKVVFPYEFVFRCVNTHILTTQAFTGSVTYDRELVFRAVREGRAHVGYDLLGSTRGFRFSAHGKNGQVTMGDSIRVGAGVTLQVLSPALSTIQLYHEGKIVMEVKDREALTHTASKPGAYRVEVWRDYLGKPRCWILSNPIYVTGVSS
jgi:hypothetical protein